MSENEYIPTGHRIFRGGKRIESELMPKDMAPFVIQQPGGAENDEKPAAKAAPVAAEEAADGAAEDIAARIAGDRVQFQADILAKAREEAGEDADGNRIADEAPADEEETE